MNTMTISGAQFRDMVLSGAVLLEKNKKLVDSLNVFPVPDGDTGTNMCMTMQSAVKEIRALPDTATATEVADALSIGALRGARGNSGVILSQIFRGYANALKGEKTINAEAFARALTMGSESAYKAVMKPKEGTILTVSRVIAEQVQSKLEQGANVYSLMDCVLEAGEKALADTPNLLPVLKEAGVVDSGGKGLLTIYKGFKLSLDGEEVESYEELVPQDTAAPANLENDRFSGESIQFGYCTELFIIHPLTKEGFLEEDIGMFRDHLNKIGDSVVVAFDRDLVKVHVHTNSPGKVLQMALRLGELDHLKIENMREQNREFVAERKRTEKEFGIIAVSAGEGLDAMFRALAVDDIISGGQTMNPSIDTIASAINRVNARNVFILPNNSNIILAAQEAAQLTEKNVVLIPTKTIPQGISACMAYSTDLTVEENEQNMRDAFAEVVSGAVTYAVRKTKYNGNEISEGDIIGLMDNKLCAVGHEVDEVCCKLVAGMLEKKGVTDGTVTLYYGADVTEDAAAQLGTKASAAFPDAEVLVQPGGQPLYYYYLAVQ